MTQSFSINTKLQFKSLRPILSFLFLSPLLYFLFILVKGIPISDYQFALPIFGLGFLLSSLPALYLHTDYLLENYDTVLLIDHSSRQLSISSRNNIATYTFDDIHNVEQNLGVYFKNRIDNGKRFATIWTYYGYLKLTLKDGQSFYFSSLMVDLLNPPLSVTTIKYRFIPYIDKSVKSLDQIELGKRNRIDYYKQKFNNDTVVLLKEKITHADDYQPEAVIAAKELLTLKSNDNSL